jgi:MFS family permease
MKQANRNLILISLSQFGAAFSFNFVNIFLPFFIFNVSPYPYPETMLWTGFIIGSTGLVTAFTSTFWGSLTHRFSPKKLYLRSFLASAVMILLMGFTTNLHLLLILRICQGLIGGVSTIGLIIVSSSSLKERVSLDLGVFQSSMTFGQLVGPLLGSLAAATFGFKGAFVAVSGMLFASFLFCHLYVTDVPLLPRETKTSGRLTIDKRIIIGWALCFAAQIQLMFLPSVLPRVFEGFRVEQNLALRLAGLVVMFYTVTAMIGTYLWTWVKKMGSSKGDRLPLYLGDPPAIHACFEQGDCGLYDHANDSDGDGGGDHPPGDLPFCQRTKGKYDRFSKFGKVHWYRPRAHHRHLYLSLLQSHDPLSRDQRHYVDRLRFVPALL